MEKRETHNAGLGKWQKKKKKKKKKKKNPGKTGKMKHKQCMSWNMGRNSEKRGK